MSEGSTTKTTTEVVSHALRKMLALGELGHPLPPERQLAKLFGVSRVTLRRAMDALEAGGTVERVQGRGTFSAHGPAIVSPATLLEGPTPTLAVLTQQTGAWFNPHLSPWTWRVCLAIQASLSAPQIDLMVVNSDRFLDAAGDMEIGGTVLLGVIAPTHLWSIRQYNALASLGLPFVGLGRTSVGMYFNIVDLNYGPGLEEAFCEIGPRLDDRVLIAGDPDPPETDRQCWLQFVLRQLDRRGVPSDAIVIRPGGMFEQQGYLATRWYIKEFGLPTLVLSDFDLSVAGAYRAIQAHASEDQAGEIDGRVRFLGSGDMEIGKHLRPKLSTLRCDYEAVADAVIEMLEAQRRTKRCQGLREIAARFIRRESTSVRPSPTSVQSESLTVPGKRG